MVDFCKNKYNSVKKLLTYFKHFFNTKKKNEIIALEDLIQQLNETPINQFSKLENTIDNYLVELKDAEKYDKLFNSFFFMGLYNNSNINDDDVKFQICLKEFNEIEKLGKNADRKKCRY